MDLSKLSDADLQALKAGDLTKVSDEGLMHLKGEAPKSIGARIGQQALNLVAGGVRGAGSIGATILAPIDIASDALAGKGLTLASNRQRRADMDAALKDFGAQPDSFAYGTGKLGGEIAGTLGAGGAVANIASKVPGLAAAAPNLLTAIRTAGMDAGTGNLLTRSTGGAINGLVSAGMVDPEQAGTGAAIGGALPGAVQVAGKAGNVIGNALSSAADSASRRLMQSAIKPTINQLKTGDADVAVKTLLENGINPTEAGVQKLKALIDDKNTAIANAIGSSNATIEKQAVLNALSGVRQKFGSQVSPTADLGAIQKVADDFAAHPNLPGSSIPVQTAQEMKQGTYRVLAGKYGQMGSAETEAQKALARGLKEEIATAVPGVGALNAEESKLLTTLSVAERRALMEMNKNPMGLAALAQHPASWAMFMADKSALFKSLAARTINSLGHSNPLAIAADPTVQQLGMRAAPALVADR